MGELVLAGCSRTTYSLTRIGDLEPERRVGDHVQPGRRGGLSRAEDGDVLTPAIGKPPSPLKNSSSGRGAATSLLSASNRAALRAERFSRDAPGG